MELPRFILTMQGFGVLDNKESSLKIFKSASEASEACEKLNHWWNLVLREGASTEFYTLDNHVSLLKSKNGS